MANIVKGTFNVCIYHPLPSFVRVEPDCRCGQWHHGKSVLAGDPYEHGSNRASHSGPDAFLTTACMAESRIVGMPVRLVLFAIRLWNVRYAPDLLATVDNG